MGTITQFPDVNGPAPEFVKLDEFGRKMFFYMATYEMDGSEWSFDFWAYSQADADARIVAIRDSIGLKGCIQILDRIDG